MNRLSSFGDFLRVALFRFFPECLVEQRIDRLVEVVVDFENEAASGRARFGVAGKERRTAPGVGLIDVFDDRAGFVEDERYSTVREGGDVPGLGGVRQGDDAARPERRVELAGGRGEAVFERFDAEAARAATHWCPLDWLMSETAL